MALFEQFTVPFNRHVPSHHEAALANPSPMQHGANECHFNYLSYAVPATLASMDSVNREVSTNVKSSYGSSIGSLSTCSAIVNMDESQRVQIQVPAEDTSPSIGVIHKQIRRTGEKVLKDKPKDMNACNGINFPSHIVDHHQACGQPVGVILQSFHDCDDSFAGGTFSPKRFNITEQSHQEATTNCEGLASAGSELSGPENGESEHDMNTDVLSCMEIDGSNQLKSKCHPLLGSSADPLQKAGVISQDESPCSVNVADAKAPFLRSSSCEKKMTSAMVIPPYPDSIKPKDVINAVGQRLFWKVRKVILRQQEVFSNQVFELHRLIMVQKLLAEMPSTLVDEHMLLGGASDKLGRDHLHNEGVSNEQKNLAITRTQAPAPRTCGAQSSESKPQRKVVPCEENEGQGARAGVLLTNNSLPHDLMSAPFGQPFHSLSSHGMSAWGYPMGSGPFVYPSGSSSLPSGLPFGGAYVMGPIPPMAPFGFPCYGQRSQQMSSECPNNQWPSAMYPNPFLAPMVNDWFAMNYQGQALLASGSEKAGPTTSAPSINMKANASTHSVQPAVVPCVQQQLGSSRLIAKSSHGSPATASMSTPPNVLSRKPAGNVGEQSQPCPGSACVASEGRGAYKGERKAEMGRSRNVKGVQLPTISGLRGADSSLGGNVLNLFPLQPSSSLGGGSEGRISRQAHCDGHVIKAVPRPALAASESAAGILLSIQRERQL